MQIKDLPASTSLAATDVLPKETSGGVTQKITGRNLASQVKSLGNLVNTTEMNAAIAQSTAVETISQSDYITLDDGIQIEGWDGVKKCGKIIQASFEISKSDGTNFGAYTAIGYINNPYRPSVRFTNPVSIASSSSSAVLINGNFAVTTSGMIAIYATASNSNVVYVSMTYMTN